MKCLLPQEKDQKVKIEFRGFFIAERIVFCPDFAEKIIRITKIVRLVPILESRIKRSDSNPIESRLVHEPRPKSENWISVFL